MADMKWIPVAERLPKHGEICICYLRFDEMRMLQWDDINYWWLGCGKGADCSISRGEISRLCG